MSSKSRRLVVAMAISCTAAISSLIGSPRISFAENVLEFPFPEVIEPARQASAKLLDAASTILRAMSQAELGDVDGANGQLREAMSVLDQSEKAFTAVAAQLKDRPIDYAKAPKEIAGVPIERILDQFKIPPPKTAGDLAKISLNEIDTLRKAVGDLKFGQKSASRAGVFRVSGALRRALDVGVVISMLADAAA